MELRLSDLKNLEDLFLAGWSPSLTWVSGARSNEHRSTEQHSNEQRKLLNIDHVVTSRAVQGAIVNANERIRKRARQVAHSLHDFKNLIAPVSFGITNGECKPLSFLTCQIVSNEFFTIELNFGNIKSDRQDYGRVQYSTLAPSIQGTVDTGRRRYGTPCSQ
ncbi:hypothetical protein GNI_090500 [Gregarina niphandrodes]|uniref:Uncharacterized protein n=1 Tax=Gregarina niphandrodes TaxID=110365 RepID=A0A023B5F6_GRENI|nr:hypothetical protein GNI_090500 [Gregarina niphandrodes]EZG60420.1 hypothetical protein GNI_090500 [Gregarina niphandrodes]|eukprot:XP_011130828.1 hypothetical protein GNI_090500 [Gregarina niphandrodes]